MKLAGLVLAGGASTRMGSPKALLRLGRRNFLERLLWVLSGSCDEVWVVLGYQARDVIRGVRTPVRPRFVMNRQPELGQFSSLRCGLAAIGEGYAGVMFTPVDYPLIRPQTVSAIAAAFLAAPGPEAIVIPRFAGKRGHPVSIGDGLRKEALRMPDSAQARELIRRHEARIRYVDVPDPGVVTDIDTPEQYLTAIAEWDEAGAR